MITVIALDENDQPVKLSVKGLAVIEADTIMCLDADVAEKLAKVLDNENPDLAERLRKLYS